MTLDEEIKEIEKAGYENALRILKKYQENPDEKLFVALGKIVEKLSQEIESLDSGILKSEDKLFERLNTIITKFSDYRAAFETSEKVEGKKSFLGSKRT